MQRGLGVYSFTWGSSQGQPHWGVTLEGGPEEWRPLEQAEAGMSSCRWRMQMSREKAGWGGCIGVRLARAERVTEHISVTGAGIVRVCCVYGRLVGLWTLGRKDKVLKAEY